MPDMITLKIGNKTYDIRDSRIGNLADLNTTDKDSVVDAINETLIRTGPTDQQVQAAVDDYLDNHPTIGGTFTNEAKNALIALLEKVAYIDGNGQTYIDTLTAELFAVTVTSITAVFTQGSAVIYDIDSLDTLKQYLVVTANYSDGTSAEVTNYSLSGTLTAGTSTITVSYGGKTTTFNVTVTEVLSGYTTVGNPTIDSDYLMTTSDGNFIKTPFEFDNNGKPWELRGVLYVSRSSHPEAAGNYFDAVNMVDSNNAASRGILVELNNGKVGTTYQQKFNLFVSDTADSWDIVNPAPTFSFSIAYFYDKDMYFKIGWTGTAYYIAVSADGVTWESNYYRETQSNANVLTGYAIAFGNKRNKPWGNGIYINSLEIDIDGAPYWRAVK